MSRSRSGSHPSGYVSALSPAGCPSAPHGLRRHCRGDTAETAVVCGRGPTWRAAHQLLGTPHPRDPSPRPRHHLLSCSSTAQTPDGHWRSAAGEQSHAPSPPHSSGGSHSPAWQFLWLPRSRPGWRVRCSPLRGVARRIAPRRCHALAVPCARGPLRLRPEDSCKTTPSSAPGWGRPPGLRRLQSYPACAAGGGRLTCMKRRKELCPHARSVRQPRRQHICWCISRTAWRL
mmetsp:Transcript_27203/g.76726  ORF Transcript_27203/g.76726 Transcript_27203/m.76726 type:complete len:231 (-) Transcript_27203:26-718(-)